VSEVLTYGYFNRKESPEEQEKQPIMPEPVQVKPEYLQEGYFNRDKETTVTEITSPAFPEPTLKEPSEPLSFGYFNRSKEPQISFAREFAYGAAQEPTVIGSLFRIGKAVVSSALDVNETYEEARARIEAERQEKIFEEFPEFRGREETAGVTAGRMGLALADPATFLMPWVKIAKAGKVASIGAAGAFGAADLAIRDEALYGEVRPEVVALGAGAGIAGGIIGEAGISLYNKVIREKVPTHNSVGSKIDKEVNIPAPTKISDIEISNPVALEQVGKQTLLETQESVNNVGFVNLQIRKIEERKLEIRDEIKKINNQTSRLKRKSLETDLMWDMDYKTYSKLFNNPLEVKKLKAERTKLNDDIYKLNTQLENIYTKEIPDNFLDVYEKSMINAQKGGVLNEGLARALTQELTRPLFGGLIGGGIGASFTEEDEGNGQMITFALMGATLGKVQKTFQSKPFELIPVKAKNAANEEFIAGFRRSWYNKLKSFTAGSHIQDLMGWSDEVAVKFGTRMYQPFGGGIALGKTSPVNPVEVEAMNQLAYWNNRAADMFSKYDDDILILAGKISNNRGLVSEKHSFLTSQDRLHPRYNEAEKLSLEIDKYNEDFKNYIKARGIDFIEQDVYGLTQILTSEASNIANYKTTIKRLKEAFTLQNDNIKKTLTKAQLKDKDFIRQTYPTLNKDAGKLAEGYLATGSRVRTNSIFSDNEDILFKTNNSAGEKYKDFVPRDEDFILQAAKHFDKDRTLFDQEARASVADLFESNPLLTTQTLLKNSVHIAEFAKQFGARGEYIKQIFTDINKRYLRTVNRTIRNQDDQYKTVEDLFNNVPGVKAAATAEKKKIKDSLEAFFGVYHIERMPTGDAARAFATFLQTGLATTRLTFVALPSMGDWLQTLSNSGYKAGAKAAIAQIQARQGKIIPLSKEGLALNQRTKQVKGRDATYVDRFLGNNIHDNILSRELSDVLLIGDTLGMRQYQRRMTDFTRRFFEAVQLGRVTRIARNFAYDAGVYRAMDVANLVGRGKTKQFLKSEQALLKEMDTLGLSRENFLYISQFKTIEDALQDNMARSYLKKAGIMSANRDAIIPLVGNRRLFTQSKDPYIKFLGSFMSWAQAKTSQTNALIARVEQGDAALFLRIAAAIPVFASVREAQVALSPNEKYKEGVNDETLFQKIGEALSYAGLNTYSIDKARGIFKYSDYGSSVMEQMAPVLGYLEDMAEIVTKPDFVPENDETLMEAFIEGLGTTIREAADVVPILEEVVPRVENILEEEPQNSMLGYATGGIVTGPDVPFTKENPADRVDPFTGQPYQEQMSRLGFNEGGRTEEYFKKLSTLEDYISKNRLVSKEAQMSAMSGEGYSDPRFIKTTGNELIDKYGMQPFPAEGSGKILSSKELGMKEKDFLINAHLKGTYDPQTDVIQYKDISAILPSHTPERTQIHEIVHRAAERSGWLDNFYNDKNLKKIAPKLTGARGKQLKHIINEGLAHSYDYTLANKRIDSEELKEQIKFRVSNYNIKDDYKDRVTKEIFESLPALQENFEQYLKDKEESK